MVSFRTLALLAILGTTVYALPKDGNAKAIGIFNVVRFPNDICNTDAVPPLRGICYTAEECSDRNGVASGSCADGFGVCCVISLNCGATTSEESTYFNLAAGTPVAGIACTYIICPASSTVSRIRLNLMMFNIAAPFEAPFVGDSSPSVELAEGAIGHCTMDKFQVIGSEGASPVICGSNDGQHMIVDTDGASCVTAAFSFGLDAANRNYMINAIQFDRLNEMGGPAGCLQFFTNATGTVNSFNWATVTTSTHLANQDYNVCVQRLTNFCSICWSPITPGATGTNTRGSFGLNNGASAAIAPTGGAAITCMADVDDSNDYIIIPNGIAAAIQTPPTVPIVRGVDKYCGRYLGLDADMADMIVCSQVTPFRLSVFTDGLEETSAAAAQIVGAADMNEASAGVPSTPTGTMGFSLGFTQIAC